MKRSVQIYDTTLRDGTQAEGISFSLVDKVRIAEKLDQFGVAYIEGGWPGSNPKDADFFVEAAKRKFKTAKIAAFGSTRKPGTKCANDPQIKMLLDAATPVVTIVGKSWLLHVHEVIRTKPEENLAMIRDTMAFLKQNGKEVIYDAEHFFDGYKDNPEYALKTLLAAQEGGADMVVLCDTNGGVMTSEIARIVKEVGSKLKAPLGIHTHNDSGLGVANALVAVEAGAVQVQGTINGYGERTGNCNITTVIANLQLKMGYSCVPPESMKRLKELSMFVDDLANVHHDIRQPFVGAASFAHKGGIHLHAVERVASSYEHINPEVVGNVRRVLVSDLSGRSNIILKARELGIELKSDTPELKTILKEVKRLENEGYEFEAAEGSLALLIQKVLHHHKPFFVLDGFHVSMRRNSTQSVVEATVKVKVGDKFFHMVAEGDGPINALDNALRKALQDSFPSLKQVTLTDYKVRIISAKEGTAAKTRVLIESTDGQEQWGTVGVSENIIEASWQALVDSVEYKLFKDESRK
jgi:2-isopropylmalate synthase